MVTTSEFQGTLEGSVLVRDSPSQWRRKLPRQGDSSKLEFLAVMANSTGVRSPSEAWGLSSLYSSVHQQAASRTSSRRTNRCMSSSSLRKVRLNRSM
jgi:hypothetical protein